MKESLFSAILFGSAILLLLIDVYSFHNRPEEKISITLNIHDKDHYRADVFIDGHSVSFILPIGQKFEFNNESESIHPLGQELLSK